MPHELPRIGWAVLGASWIAEEFVIDAIRAVPGSDAVGVYSRSDERGRAYAERTNLDTVWTSLDAALSDDRVQAVFVGTLNELHHDQVMAAVAAGKHVLCEKPLALTLSDAVDMQSAADEAGVVLGTNHTFRDQAVHRKMRALIDDGVIGDPVAARTFFGVTLIDRVKTWRLSDQTAGGVLFDVSVHTFDILRFLLDSEIVDVQAMAGNQGVADAGIEDVATGSIRFQKEVLANFHDSYTVNHATSSVEVHGSKGSLIATGALSVLPQGELRLVVDGKTTSIDPGPLVGPYQATINAFTSAIRGTGSPSASADDGVRSLVAVLAARQSVESRRTIAVDSMSGSPA